MFGAEGGMGGIGMIVIYVLIFAAMYFFLIRPNSKKKKAELKEVTFHVHLHCANCVKKVEENIAFEKGVKDLKVSLDNQTVYIKYDAAKTSEAALKAAIEELGYPVSDGHDHGHHHGHAH